MKENGEDRVSMYCLNDHHMAPANLKHARTHTHRLELQSVVRGTPNCYGVTEFSLDESE